MTRYSSALEQMERKLFAEVMLECNNNQSEAAKTLGINRGTFRQRLKLYGMLTPKEYKRSERVEVTKPKTYFVNDYLKQIGEE